MNAFDTTERHLLPDDPISSSSQDRLGRLPFAKSLAANLNAYSNLESLVVGLYGPWGSGKSSLLNLVEEELKKVSPEGDHSPIVIRFDPWNFNSVDQLIFMFFQSMRSALGSDSKDKNLKKIRLGLETLRWTRKFGQVAK